MASSYSSNLRLEKQGSGENANTWGDRLNDNMIELVDTAVAGVTAVDVDAATSVTLTENNGASDQGRHMGLRMTGALTADVTVTYTAPEKIYFVNNETTGGHNVIMNNGSTQVTVGTGANALLATNGSDSYALRSFESGTRLAFNQNSAPIGWSVITSASHNDAALRIVNAAVSGGQVDGTNGFNSVFNTGITVSVTGQSTETATLTGNTVETVLSIGAIPAHSHNMREEQFNVGSGAGSALSRPIEDSGTFHPTTQTGGGAGHSHSLAGQGSHSHTVSITQSNAFNLDVKYVNFIVCEKD